jgi:hypothetical protein
MRRTLILFLTSLLLWTVVAQVNHALTGIRVYVFIGSLYLVYAALTQPLLPGLFSVILGGFLCDANAPRAVFGSHTLLFIVGFFVVHNLRDRIPRDDLAGRVVIALLSNFALFLVFSFAQLIRSPAPAAVWPRLLADLVASQVFLTLITPWFFALQHRALVLAQVEREAYA